METLTPREVEVLKYLRRLLDPGGSWQTGDCLEDSRLPRAKHLGEVGRSQRSGESKWRGRSPDIFVNGQFGQGRFLGVKSHFSATC
jgi:hypothetical protein